MHHFSRPGDCQARRSGSDCDPPHGVGGESEPRSEALPDPVVALGQSAQLLLPPRQELLPPPMYSPAAAASPGRSGHSRAVTASEPRRDLPARRTARVSHRVRDRSRAAEEKKNSNTTQKPLTTTHRPSHQSSIINHQSTIINYQSSIINHHSSSGLADEGMDEWVGGLIIDD